MRTKVAFVMCISSFFLTSYWSAAVGGFCQLQYKTLFPICWEVCKWSYKTSERNY